jgi:hypothetical protein
MAGELRALPVASELGVRRETSRTGTILINDQVVGTLYPMRSFANHIFNFHHGQLHAQLVAIALGPAVTLVSVS